MLTQELVKEKVFRFSQELKLLKINLKKVIIFGSYVNGKPHEWSDIDVALVADNFTGFGFEDRKSFSKINIKKEFQLIETKTFPTKELDNKNPFLQEIIKTGLEIKI